MLDKWAQHAQVLDAQARIDDLDQVGLPFSTPVGIATDMFVAYVQRVEHARLAGETFNVELRKLSRACFESALLPSRWTISRDKFMIEAAPCHSTVLSDVYQGLLLHNNERIAIKRIRTTISQEKAIRVCQPILVYASR